MSDPARNAIGVFAIGVGAVGVSGLRPAGYQQVSPLDAPVALDVPPAAIIALISPEGAPVRYRDDGVEPEAGVGMPLGVGATLHYCGDLTGISFIEQTPSARLNVLYYGSP